MLTLLETFTVPTKGTAYAIDIKLISYELKSTSASFYWVIVSDDNKNILDGNITINSPELDLWGTDDEYIIDWVLLQLDLRKLGNRRR